ncbi:hypothetical protein CPY51_14190 [Rhizobium tubonense]|uniref:Uncharacterized protein n=1 Tax=Rhizobium tubonense TaxID=484088 RepID=A0A2W4ESU5_9HYPH|nr:hypothetical protein CPY51_14190 [Rhizobium tubonense]
MPAWLDWGIEYGRHRTAADCSGRENRRLSCHAGPSTTLAFEVTSKRRKSFPSEAGVKTGNRFVHGDVELIEKLGRNDLCPCSSRRRFQELLS